MDPQPPADSAYRLSIVHVIRMVAPFEVLVGLAWIVTALLGLPHGWTLVLVGLTVALALAGAYLFIRPPTVLTLTEAGYRVGFARDTGRRKASGREVESVGTADAAAVAVLVFTLADGGQSAIPVSLLGARNSEAQREVHERLNRAYGYRKF